MLEPDFFWPFLFPHAHRIASFSANGYNNPDTPPDMEAVLAAALPPLASLSIGPRWPNTQSPKFLGVKLGSKCLQTLTLMLFPPQWDAMLLPCLRLLEVCNQELGGPIRWERSGCVGPAMPMPSLVPTATHGPFYRDAIAARPLREVDLM